MEGTGRVVLVAMDGCDPGLARRWADEGHLPNLARMLGEGTAAPVLAPPGVFVSANWPTIFTGIGPDRHGYLCWDEIDPLTYEHRETEPNAETVGGTPLWEALSDVGRRSVVIDVPHTWAVPIEGSMIVEWGCHDRHHGPHSWPPALLDEVNALGGEHPVGCAEPPGRDQFAPCDYLDRSGAVRTPEEEAALLDRLRRGVDRKRDAALHLMESTDWDLFMCVFAGTHCVGHQLWHHHDTGHPRHDPAAVRALGGDPMLDIYRRVDAAVGELVERLAPDDTVYLLMPHGMVAHHDGTDVLDPVLARLDRFLDEPDGAGLRTRLAASALDRMPRALRRQGARLAAPLVRRRAAAAPPTPDEAPAPLAERRWFAVPNNSVSGAVRLNLAGREGAGRVRPEARREVLDWLADRLREVVNVDTGRPMVREVIVTEDVYRRHDADMLADLYIDWDRDDPIERVWSPTTGTIERPYGHWRTGDHIPRGLVVARGPGIAAGDAGEINSVDLAPTVAAALGVALGDVDGHAVAALLPVDADPGVRRRPMGEGTRQALRRSLDTLERRAARRRGAPTVRWDVPRVPEVDEVAAGLAGLGGAHHETREMVRALADRVGDLEREVLVGRTSAWIRHQPVDSKLLVSVVISTHDRRAFLEEAIASVRAQTYPNWELLVVDDGSTDGTDRYLAGLDDPRIRTFRTDGVGTAGARNVGLDHLGGDVVVHLDDDNRFEPDWLKAVALAFDGHEDVKVAYGARLVDDTGRHHGLPDSGEVGFQLLRWDREAALDFNRVDMNVLAHRPSTVRFDERLRCFVDWDLLLSLTADAVAVEIPVVAACYTTVAPGRLSDATPPDVLESEMALVRSKHRAVR